MMPERAGDNTPRGGSPHPPRGRPSERGGYGDPPRESHGVPPRGGPGAATVEADGLRFAYVRGEAVLDGLSMRADAGRLTCVLGPNGSGKTTLLRVLVGLARPAAGEVRLAGRPLGAYRRADLARCVAYVPQETLAAAGFTVAETVLMGRSPHIGALGLESERDWQVAGEALRQTDTERFAERGLDDLSGGERQRVLLARALAQEPDVVLLDEPTAFLDIKHQHAIYGLLRRLAAEEGKTVVAVSHDVGLASAYGDHLVLLSRGRVAAAGTPGEVVRPAILGRVYETPVEVRTDEATGRPYVLPRPPG